MQRLEETRRLDEKRQEAREKFGLPAGSAVRWVLTEGPDKRHRMQWAPWQSQRRTTPSHGRGRRW